MHMPCQTPDWRRSSGSGTSSVVSPKLHSLVDWQTKPPIQGQRRRRFFPAARPFLGVRRVSPRMPSGSSAMSCSLGPALSGGSHR